MIHLPLVSQTAPPQTQALIKKQLYVQKMYEPSYISEQMTNVEQLPRQGQVDWQPWRIIFPIISEGAKNVLSLSTPSRLSGSPAQGHH